MKAKHHLIVIVIALLFLTLTSTASTPALALPKIITVTVDPVGSALNNRMVALSQAIEAHVPMKVRLEPVDTQHARYAPLHFGEAEFTLESAGSAYPIFNEGLKGVGYIKIRWVWYGSPAKFAMYTRGSDTDIQTIADLKGKRYPQTSANAPFSKKLEALLHFGNITLDDVQVVDCSSVATAQTGVLEGNFVASFAHNFSSRAIELAASRRGIRHIETPVSDTEGWARMRAIHPPFAPVIATAAGLAKGETIETFGEEEGLLATPETSADVVYAINKGMKAGFDQYKSMEPELVNWTWERAIKVPSLEFPFHDGTVRFLKDMGVWTAAHEAFQQNALEMERKKLGK